VAAPPPWRTGISDVARWVTARGLATHLSRRDLPLEPVAWQSLVAECAEHRLTGLLVGAVAAHELPVDAPQLREVAELEVALTRTRMVYEPRMVEIVASLESAGIDVRLLKGSALARLDYPDPQQRPTGDIDVLVRGEQLDDALAVARAAGAVQVDPDPLPGYGRAVGKGAALVLPDGAELDVHRLLVWGPLGVRLRPADLWQRSRAFDVDGYELRTLGLEETLLHATCHLMVGGRPRALSVRDVAQLLGSPGLDEQRVTGLARRWGIEAVLAAAVRLAAVELDLVEGGALDAWSAGYAPTRRDRAWLRVGRPGAALPAVEPLATWLELPRAGRRVLVRATLHPSPGTWPTPRRRVARVVRRAGRALSDTR
jgi:hypothetical protein